MAEETPSPAADASAPPPPPPAPTAPAPTAPAPDVRPTPAPDVPSAPAAAPPLDPREEARLSRRRTWTRRLRRAREIATRSFKALIVIVLFTFILFFDRIVYSVYPGQVGVLWSRFLGGTRIDHIYGEGIHIVWPWDEFYIYLTREQELRSETVIYARDGLEITVHVSVRFRPKAESVPRLHQTIGPDYIEKIIQPETTSTIRRVLGNYSPEKIYAQDEQGLLEELITTLRSELDPETYLISEFLVLELRLPTAIEDAIKAKLTEEQKMLSYRFRLDKEKDEKERRIIEAEGLRAFETISGVPILKWRGIEATEELARSPNAKIVLMGTGEGQLPVILNADFTPSAVPATAGVGPEAIDDRLTAPRPAPPELRREARSTSAADPAPAPTTPPAASPADAPATAPTAPTTAAPAAAAPTTNHHRANDHRPARHHPARHHPDDARDRPPPHSPGAMR